MGDSRLKDATEFIDNLNFNEIINVNFNHKELMQKGIPYLNRTYIPQDIPITVFLSGDIFKDFKSLIRKLFKKLNENKFNISEEFIENTLLECILMRYDKNNYGKHLQKQILNNISNFSVYYIIEGLNLINNNKLKLGDSVFFRVTKHKLNLILDTGYNNQFDLKNYNDLLNKIYCQIKVNATDPVAAKAITLNILSKDIDTLNFIAGMLKINYLTSGFVYYPNYSIDSQYNKTFIHKNNKLINTNHSSNHPRIFDLNILKMDKELYKLFSKIVRFTNIKTDNESIKRLLTAIQWCGKAMNEERNEIAFINYITSLESLLLTSKEGELSFRLSLYGSYLVSNHKSYRLIIFNRIKELYHLRSIITHEGNNEVDNNDLTEIKNITISVILGVIYNKKYKFLKAKKTKEFDDILKNMVLSHKNEK